MTPSAQEFCDVPKTKENILNIDCAVLIFSEIGGRCADNSICKYSHIVSFRFLLRSENA